MICFLCSDQTQIPHCGCASNYLNFINFSMASRLALENEMKTPNTNTLTGKLARSCNSSVRALISLRLNTDLHQSPHNNKTNGVHVGRFVFSQESAKKKGEILGSTSKANHQNCL